MSMHRPQSLFKDVVGGEGRDSAWEPCSHPLVYSTVE